MTWLYPRGKVRQRLATVLWEADAKARAANALVTAAPNVVSRGAFSVPYSPMPFDARDCHNAHPLVEFFKWDLVTGVEGRSANRQPY